MFAVPDSTALAARQPWPARGWGGGRGGKALLTLPCRTLPSAGQGRGAARGKARAALVAPRPAVSPPLRPALPPAPRWPLPDQSHYSHVAHCPGAVTLNRRRAMSAQPKLPTTPGHARRRYHPAASPRQALLPGQPGRLPEREGGVADRRQALPGSTTSHASGRELWGRGCQGRPGGELGRGRRRGRQRAGRLRAGGRPTAARPGRAACSVRSGRNC